MKGRKRGKKEEKLTKLKRLAKEKKFEEVFALENSGKYA